MPTSLLERYGRSKVAQIIAEFYAEVLASPTLGRYFDSANIERLIDHQRTFMATFMGGPPSFTRDQMRAAHDLLDITGDDFSEMMRILEACLARFEVEAEDVQTVMRRYRGYQHHIVKPA
jgi:hemoglobin